jgi:Aspartyl protease
LTSFRVIPRDYFRASIPDDHYRFCWSGQLGRFWPYVKERSSSLGLTTGSLVGRIWIALLLTGLAFYLSAYSSTACFTADRAVATLPFELDDNLIYLRVRLNGSSPRSFILDTGAPTMLQLRQGRSLGLRPKAVGKADGIGNNQPIVYQVTRNVSFQLQGVVLADQRPLAISLDQVEDCINRAVVDEQGRCVSFATRAAAGTGTERPVDGVLGAELFDRWVVEIDYPARRIRLFDPKRYQYQGNGERLPLELTSNHSFVQARVAGIGGTPIPGRFVVDTGASTAVRLTKRFVEAHGLLPPRERLKAVPECGLGGETKEPAWEGSVERLYLGRLEIRQPVTVFSQESVPRGYDGAIGGAVYRRFRVIVDYPHRQMILE